MHNRQSSEQICCSDAVKTEFLYDAKCGSNHEFSSANADIYAQTGRKDRKELRYDVSLRFIPHRNCLKPFFGCSVSRTRSNQFLPAFKLQGSSYIRIIDQLQQWLRKVQRILKLSVCTFGKLQKRPDGKLSCSRREPDRACNGGECGGIISNANDIKLFLMISSQQSPFQFQLNAKNSKMAYHFVRKNTTKQ